MSKHDQAQGSLAVIGAGASGLYLLRRILQHAHPLRRLFDRITVYEQSERLGSGMPYHPERCHPQNFCNIASPEIPGLGEMSFADFLKACGDETLRPFGLSCDAVEEGGTYPRALLGLYFEDRFNAVVADLRAAGWTVQLRAGALVTDLRPAWGGLDVVTPERVERHERVVIASGHRFPKPDRPEHGYHASPWPIDKLMPAEGTFHGFAIGTLGGSLSAFDVVAALAEHHGTFSEPVSDQPEGVRVPTYHLKAGAEGFRIVLHTSRGWLPHLTYEQAEPFREIYRHVTREGLLALRDPDGRLRLGRYFDAVCRPALRSAFDHDGWSEVAGLLSDPASGLEDWIEAVSKAHSGGDPFEVMRDDLPGSARSLRTGRPIRWMEVFDDLMYTLNYHADLMPAEDHLRLGKLVMPLLTNVIAAMPLRSARTLLSLHDAGVLDVQAGRAHPEPTEDGVLVRVDEGADLSSEHRYRLFVDCTGQPAIGVDTYPFRGLVEAGWVTEASAAFADPEAAQEACREDADACLDVDGRPRLRLKGIAVDAVYRPLRADGAVAGRGVDGGAVHLHDIAFPHTIGVRPYSYGLQACDHTAGLVVEAWVAEAQADATGQEALVEGPVAVAADAASPLQEEVGVVEPR